MNCPCLAHTVRSAVGFLASRPDLHANPVSLLHSCQEWTLFMLREIDGDNSIILVDREMIETAMQEAGLRAAKEVAMPCKKTVIDNLINPEDLK